MTSHLLLVAAIAAEVIGTLLMKRTGGITRLATGIAVLACYSLAFFLLA